MQIGGKTRSTEDHREIGYLRVRAGQLGPLPSTPRPLLTQRDLYAYRRATIELLFQRIIQACELKVCPAKCLARTGTFVLASMWLYQGLFLDNRHHGPGAHIKELIDEGRWRITARITRRLQVDYFIS